MFPGSAWTSRGFKSKSSRLEVPKLTCFKRSVLPIISFKFLKPNSAKTSLTSLAIKVNKLITFSGVPVNFFIKLGSWVQTPTGQVFEWHWRTIMHPIATKAAVPIPNSSAPIMAAITTSLPVFIPPSVLSVTWCLSPFKVNIWFTSVSPISQEIPACLMLVCGLAPVPPECPEIKITSAFALATPAAMVPTPVEATSLTPTLALGLTCLRS